MLCPHTGIETVKRQGPECRYWKSSKAGSSVDKAISDNTDSGIPHAFQKMHKKTIPFLLWIRIGTCTLSENTKEDNSADALGGNGLGGSPKGT